MKIYVEALMKDINHHRRATDSERIDSIEDQLLKCSNTMKQSVDNLSVEVNSITSNMKELQESLILLSEQMKEYSESGLLNILKDYNEQKTFMSRSESYGKRIVFIGKVVATIGGIFVALAYAMTHYGNWPSGNP